jgi:hypothetical protein
MAGLIDAIAIKRKAQGLYLAAEFVPRLEIFAKHLP